MERLVDEPYDLLLGQYRDHALLSPYLKDSIPTFEYIYPILDMLSSEERIMVKVAFAFYSEDRSATVRELLELSDICFDRVVQAIRARRQSKGLS
jgi:hypothetical protein